MSSVIADRPTDEMYRSGLEIDAQCARCGSSVDSERCHECGGDGWVFGSEDEDVCDCGTTQCWACNGNPIWHRCMSSPEWCETNPLPGREQVQRGKIEWFTVEERS